MGKRTSVYLSDDLAEAVSRSGLSLVELIRLGVHQAEKGLTLVERVSVLPGGARALQQARERRMPGVPFTDEDVAALEAEAEQGRVEIIPLEPKPAARSRRRKARGDSAGTSPGRGHADGGTGTPEPAAGKIVTPSAQRAKRGAGCDHPKGRRQKGGTYCPACGTGGLKP